MTSASRPSEAFETTRRRSRTPGRRLQAAIQFVVDHKDAFGALAAGAATGVGTYKALSLAMAAYSAVMAIATVAQTLYAIATGTATARSSASTWRSPRS
jgi:hypothetical protein